MKLHRILAWFLLISLNLSPVQSFARQDTEKDAVWVNQVFLKGKNFYEAGDTKSAVREWNSLEPYLDQYPSFKRVIDYLKSQINAPAKPAAAAPDAWSGSPTQVREAFLRGKASYQAGDWDGALAQWEKIKPYLAPESEEAKLIEKLKMERETLRVTDRQGEEAADQKEAVLLTPPAELKDLLLEAKRKLEDQIRVMESRRQAMEKEAVFEQAWVNSTFDKGKAAYTSGQYDQAIEEWDKLIFKLGRDPELKADIEKLKESYNQYRQTQVGYANSEAALQTAVRPADDPMRIYFEQVEIELQKKSKETAQRGQELQMSQAEQQRHVQEIFDKGKALYLKGEVQEAMDQWMLLSRYFDGNPALRSAFLSAQATAHSYQQAELSLKQMPDMENYKLRLPDGFSNYLDEAMHQLSVRTRDAEAKRDKTEKAVGEKRAQVLQAFESGKTLYADGKVSEAVGSWRKAVPWVEEGDFLEVELQKMETNSQAYLKEMRALQEAERSAAKYFASPADFLKQLQGFNKDLKDQTQAATDSRLNLQQSQNERQAQASSLLHKANFAHQSGKADEAAAAWKKLAPYLDPLSEEKVIIDGLEQNLADSEVARKQLDQVKARKDDKIKIPEDLKAALIRTNSDLVKETNAAVERRRGLEVEISTAETQARSAFEKGKMSFLAGRLPDALDEWRKLHGQWAGQAQDEALIESLAKSRLEAEAARKQLDEMRARKAEKIQIPEDLKTALLRTHGDLMKETNAAIEERRAIETRVNMAETQARSAFEKGKMSFQGGRLADALEEWKKLGDSLDPASDVPGLLRQLESRLKDHDDAQLALEQAHAGKNAKLAPPAELSGLLKSGAEEAAEETEKLRAQRAALEKEIQDRNAFVNSTFEEGKKLAAEGKWQEAVYAWDKLKGSVDDSSGIPQALDNLKKWLEMFEDTRRSNADFTANRYQNLKIPFTDDLIKLLTDMDADIRGKTQKAQEERAAMEKSLAENEAWVNSTFEKGKAYYEVGKYKEAIEFWASLQPKLKDETKIQPLMAGLSERYQNMAAAQKAAEEAAARKSALFETPTELPRMLEDLSEKLKTMHFEASSETAKAQQVYADRKAALETVFQKGSELYQAGDLGGALKEWSAMPPYVQDEARVKTLLDNLNQSWQALNAAKQASADAQARQDARFPAPEGLSELLLDAARTLDKEAQATELQRQGLDKAIAAKEDSVKGVFAEGKAFYDQGKMTEAFLRWRSLLPAMTQAEELGEQLTKAEESYQRYANSKEQNRQALLKKETKVTAPAELSEILDTVNRSLSDQIFDMKNRTSQTEKMLEDRKSWVDVTFQKGKLAYNQGRYKDAVAEWNTLLPFIENGDTLKASLSDFERNLEVSLDSARIVEEANIKKEGKFQAPDELGVLLTKLNDQIKNEALEASAAKIRAEQTFSERQKWMTATFDAGKAFYQEGKTGEAIAEWSKLSPYLDEKSGMQKLLDAVKENYEAATLAKKGAVEAAASDYQGLKLPYAEQMSKLLSEADAKLAGEAEQYRAKQKKVEETLAERQEWSVTTFNKGKVFYDQGQYDEALNQWERLLPYLKEGSDLRRQIETLRRNYDDVLAGQNSAGPAAGEKPVTLKNESELLSVLEEANAKLRSQADEAHAKASAAEKEITDRQQWIEYTFQKGKAFYDQGNYQKAVEEWTILGPYLAEHPRVRDGIEEAKKNYSEGKMAERAIANIEAKKASLMPLPQSAQTPPAQEATPAPTAPVAPAPAVEGAAARLPAPGDAAQLVSGEIVSIDAGQRTLAVKLYSESGADETLTVSFDESTQIDGSDAKAVSSIQNGSNIDLRYNPQTSRAVYIYVY